MANLAKIAQFELPNCYLDLSELKRFSSGELVFELLNKVNISDFDFLGELRCFEEWLLLLLLASLLFFLGAPLKTLFEILLIDPSIETLSSSLSVGSFDTPLLGR